MMIEELRSAFDRISRGLFSGSLNYCASFMVVKCTGMAGRSLVEILSVAIGNKLVLGGTGSASERDVLDAMRDAFDYQGDDGSHPGRDYLASMTFKQDADFVMAQLEGLVSGASLLTLFWLKEGHPFYPVFWDFAFMIERGDDAFVLIGSSSD